MILWRTILSSVGAAAEQLRSHASLAFFIEDELHQRATHVCSPSSSSYLHAVAAGTAPLQLHWALAEEPNRNDGEGSSGGGIFG